MLRSANCSSASVREPALLLYLDAPSNRKEHPNENLARELMELFTLGIGNFTEADVKEAARALTGWTVEDATFRDALREARRRREDAARPQGRWAASDLLSIVLERPATARRIARTDLRSFAWAKGPSTNPRSAALADELTASRLDIGHAVETVIRSRAFFASSNLGSRVVGPVEFVIGACRALVPGPAIAQHAAPGGLDEQARAGVVRAAQRRRLARGPGVADRPVAGRSGQLRRGSGRRPRRRPAGTSRRRRDRHRARARRNRRGRSDEAASALLLGIRVAIAADPAVTTIRPRPPARLWRPCSPRPRPRPADDFT